MNKMQRIIFGIIILVQTFVIILQNNEIRKQNALIDRALAAIDNSSAALDSLNKANDDLKYLCGYSGYKMLGIDPAMCVTEDCAHMGPTFNFLNIRVNGGDSIFGISQANDITFGQADVTIKSDGHVIFGKHFNGGLRAKAFFNDLAAGFPAWQEAYCKAHYQLTATTAPTSSISACDPKLNPNQICVRKAQ